MCGQPSSYPKLTWEHYENTTCEMYRALECCSCGITTTPPCDAPTAIVVPYGKTVSVLVDLEHSLST